MNNSKINFFPYKCDKNSLSFYIAYFCTVIWACLQLVTVIIASIPSILSVFNIFSIIFAIITSFFGVFFVYNVLLRKDSTQHKYNVFRSYIGYCVILTYVLTSLPRLVGTFSDKIGQSYAIFCFVLTLICFVLTLASYYALRSARTRMFIGLWTKVDIDFELKLKKDKQLRKEHQAKLKKSRTFLQNLWYEWVDVILQAVIIALVIQQFIFQMYQIPSESMVPTFLVGDRVIVNKFNYGSHIPLTDKKLPPLHQPKAGDIVVFQNPDESVAYKDAFTRVMYPFVYMLTLSLVDIDKKPDGSPKERFLVKRLIGTPGEKLFILNDKVYKKTRSSDWVLMSQVPNQREFGNVDIYNEDKPSIRSQRMTSQLRDYIQNAENIVDNMSVEQVSEDFNKEKAIFLQNVANLGTEKMRNKIVAFIQDSTTSVYSSMETMVTAEHVVYNLNAREIRRQVSPDGIEFYLKQYRRFYENHYRVSIYQALMEWQNRLDKSTSGEFFDKNIVNTYNTDSYDNPYTIFMKKLNLINKCYKLKIVNNFINDDKAFREIYADEDKYRKSQNYRVFADFDYLSIYLNGSSSLSSYNTFEMRNFPEYPTGENYLSAEYFVMGDNRYNSLDGRFGYNDREIAIDATDSSLLTTKVNVSWQPHTIKEKHLLGKAFARYFPLDRIGLLK